MESEKQSATIDRQRREPKWNVENITKTALMFSTRGEFAEKNKPAYEAARLLGLLDELFDLVLHQWDEHAIKNEACKYSSRTEMARKSGAAYNAARRLGLISSLFPSKLKNWGVDEVEEVAKCCLSKKDLKIKNATAYNAALRLGIIDGLFDNQGRIRERDCVYLWEVSDEPGLYKVGITSSSMGTYRITQVAKEVNCTPNILFLKQVGYEAAKVIEREMKRIGTPYKFSKKFYGHSEFRYMSTSEVERCVKFVIKSF